MGLGGVLDDLEAVGVGNGVDLVHRGALACDENKSEIGIESLEVFENIAYIMAKHADSNVPDNPDDFLEQFNTFSIYEILPQLIELWGLNTATQVESKKNIAKLTAR